MENKELSQIADLFLLFQFDRIVLLVGCLSLLFFAVHLVQKWSAKLHTIFPTKKLLVLQFTTMLSFFAYIIGTMGIIYATLQPPKELLIAIGGSVAVAIGFSLKDLVGSIIAGIILLFDRPFQVGDRVEFDGVYGEIVSIGLRAVRLNTLDDNLVTIPNGRFFTDIVASGNSGALDMMVVTHFHLALEADFQKAKDLLYEVAVTSPYVYMDKPVTIVMEEVAVASRLAIKLSVKAYVFDVAFEKAFQTNLTQRGLEYLEDEKILRPKLFEMPRLAGT